MGYKKPIRLILTVSLFFLALGGWLLHMRIHPVSRGAFYLLPFLAGFVSVFFIPLLFLFRRTLDLAYLLNGFSVIIGTVAMAHFSISHFEGPVSFMTVMTNTLIADIGLLWAKFAIGRALYLLYFLKTDTDTLPRGRYFRYPNMGWWWVHLAGFAAVYYLGLLLSR